MTKTKLLCIYFYVFGIANIITSVITPVFFADELLWNPGNMPTDLMIGSLYFTMGLVMILIARNPANNKGFIDFIVSANILHALVMIIFAQKPGHIYVDAFFTGAMGIIPILLYPWPLKRFLRYD